MRVCVCVCVCVCFSAFTRLPHLLILFSYVYVFAFVGYDQIFVEHDLSPPVHVLGLSQPAVHVVVVVRVISFLPVVLVQVQGAVEEVGC